MHNNKNHTKKNSIHQQKGCAQSYHNNAMHSINLELNERDANYNSMNNSFCVLILFLAPSRSLSVRVCVCLCIYFGIEFVKSSTGHSAFRLAIVAGAPCLLCVYYRPFGCSAVHLRCVATAGMPDFKFWLESRLQNIFQITKVRKAGA